MPPTANGLRRFLDFLLYGVFQTSNRLGNGEVFLRTVEEISVRKLLEEGSVRLSPTDDPVEIIRTYNEHLDETGILDAGDVEYGSDAEGIQIAMGESCPYREVCDWILAEGGTTPCFRSVALREVLRLATNKTYDGRLRSFGTPCRITLSRVRWEAADHGN